jgi:hypothetical protein
MKPLALVGAGLILGLALNTNLNAQGAAPAAPPPPGAGFTDTADNFRGIKFGAPASSVKGLKPEENRGTLRLYTRPGDKLAFGPTKLDTIIYYFWEDKFVGVSMHTEGMHNTSMLQRTAQTLFGKGKQPDGDHEIWEGKAVTIHYGDNPVTWQGELHIRSNQLEKDMETAVSKTASEAMKDL